MTDILALDIGSGTQDILIYKNGREMENNFKMVLPSQTQVIADKIHKCTELGEDVFLYGHLMGGGASSKAIKNHLKAGYRVYATEQAALTIKDNLDRVKEQGIHIVKESDKQESCLHIKDCCRIKLQDVDLQALEIALQQFEIDLPRDIIIAVQDHGFSPDGSNRKFRFKHWENFLEQGGHLSQLLYEQKTIPDYFTRMEAAANCCQDIKQDTRLWAMDTGAASILGAMEDGKVAEAVKNGAVLINIGNQHTIAFLVYRDRVLGVFEHHTKMLTEQSLLQYIDKFVSGQLDNEQILNEHGHGCMVLPEAKKHTFDFWSVTGPKREIGEKLGYMAIPYGDMMMSGPYGMVNGLLKYGQRR